MTMSSYRSVEMMGGEADVGFGAQERAYRFGVEQAGEDDRMPARESGRTV